MRVDLKRLPARVDRFTPWMLTETKREGGGEGEERIPPHMRRETSVCRVCVRLSLNAFCVFDMTEGKTCFLAIRRLSSLSHLYGCGISESDSLSPLQA